MIGRMRVGWLVVFSFVSVLLVPVDAFGRAGGFGGRGAVSRSVPIGSTFHPPVVVPQAQAHSPPVRLGGRLGHRFGYGFWPWAGFGYYGSGFGVPDYVGPSEQPVLAEPDNTGTVPIPELVPGALRPVVVYHPGCQAETTTVPLGNGDNHSINIVRCYSY